MIYEIPLDNTPDQEFNVTVDVGDKNVSLLLHLRYNTVGAFWNMDVADGNTGTVLISRVPMLPGNGEAFNMLRQFSHLAIGTAMIMPMADKVSSDNPDITNLGTDFVLLWGDGVFE